MFGLHEVAIGTSVEGAFFLEVSKVVTLGAESFSAVFCWGVLKG